MNDWIGLLSLSKGIAAMVVEAKVLGQAYVVDLLEQAGSEAVQASIEAREVILLGALAEVEVDEL